MADEGIGSDTIQGNYIGTNTAGNTAIPNGVGIVFTGGNSTIGGTVAAARNVISGNAGAGIRLDVFVNDLVTTGDYLPNYVQGNLIGVAADGFTPLGNGGDGIVADGPAAFIGGVLAGQANVIAYNGGNGVTVAIDPEALGSGQRTSIRGNTIYANTKLGIDLGNDGVTPNDPADPDKGANTLQNFPIITAASSDGAATLVSGSFNSAPGADYAGLLFRSGDRAVGGRARSNLSRLGERYHRLRREREVCCVTWRRHATGAGCDWDRHCQHRAGHVGVLFAAVGQPAGRCQPGPRR